MPYSESEFIDPRSLQSYLDDIRKSLGKPNITDVTRGEISDSISSMIDKWFTHPEIGERLMEEKILTARAGLSRSNIPVTPSTVSRQTCVELYYSFQRSSLKYYLDHKKEAGCAEFTAGMYDILFGFSATSDGGLHLAEKTGKDINWVREHLVSINPNEFVGLWLKPYQDTGLVVSGLKLGFHTYDRVNVIANRVMSSGS